MKKNIVALVVAVIVIAGASLRAQNALPNKPPPPASSPASQPIANDDQKIKRVANVAGPNVVIAGQPNMAVRNGFRNILDNTKTRIIALPESGNCKLNELLHVSIAEGQLQIEPGDFVPQNMGQTRVKVEGSDAIWVVSRMGGGNFVAGQIKNGINSIARYDFSDPQGGEWWQISVSMFGGVFVNAQCINRNITFMARGDVITLTINDMAHGGNQNFQAATLAQLQTEHQKEVREYLLPVLRKLGGWGLLHAGYGDLYTVFSDIPADAAATAKITALLPALDADDFNVRENASKDLTKLGPAGVLAAMRMDRSRLSAEQTMRLDALVSNEGHRTSLKPAAALKDLDFLIDALGEDDAAVSAAARKAVEKLAGHAIEYDAQADMAKRTVVLDGLWKKLNAELESKGARPAPAAKAANDEDDSPLVPPSKRIVPLDQQ